MPSVARADNAPALRLVERDFKDTSMFTNQIYKNIFNDDLFNSMYTLAVVKNPHHPQVVCYGYFLDTYLNKLVSSGQTKLVEELPK